MIEFLVACSSYMCCYLLEHLAAAGLVAVSVFFLKYYYYN